jgi:hypothetical protein
MNSKYPSMKIRPGYTGNAEMIFLPIAAGMISCMNWLISSLSLQMVRVGAMLNVLTLGVVMGATLTYGGAIFDFDEFPEWAQEGDGGGGIGDPCAV